MPRLTQPIKTFLRGTLELLLLEALRDAPLHGYAIARKIETETADGLSVEEGSMYPALYRLEDRGLVSASWKNTRGRRTRVYALTPAGRKQLESGRRDWAAFARSVGRMIGAKP